MAANQLRFDVFLSYNSAERAAVERVAERLRREGIEVWWDGRSLVGGAFWQSEIVDGLQSSRACAVFVGPAGLGNWARQEIALALDRAAKDPTFRLFMVLLPGAPELTDRSLAFVRMRTWVNLRNGVDAREGIDNLVAAITGTPRRRDLVPAPTGTCPYRGLEAFEEDNAEFFFGRDGEVALAVAKLRVGRFLAVLGPSGSGKSSLVRAGIVPALRRDAVSASESFTIRVFTPGPRPIHALGVQLARLFPGQALQETIDLLRYDHRTLDMAVSLGLAERPAHERVVLVVDQFEELFTLCADEQERQAFLDNLTYAAAVPGGRVVLIVGMRADFYHRCAPYPELRALVGDEQLLVGPLDKRSLRQAIEEPASRVGLELEAGLPQTILDDVMDRPGALPLLEHMLLELWQRRRGTMLTLEAYDATGRVHGALERRAEAIYCSFTERQRHLARRVLLRLVQPGDGVEDTRRRAEMEELLVRPGDEPDVEAVVGALADQRLLTVGRDELTDKATVELAHEALIEGWPQLRTWVSEDRETLRAQRRLTEAALEWDRTGRNDDGLLYRGARLATWQERSLDDIAHVERLFLRASNQRQSREQSAARRRKHVAVGGVFAAVTIVAVVALVLLRQVAEREEIAVSQRLAAEATAMVEVDDLAALSKALDAVQRRPTSEAQKVLRRAVESPLRAVVGYGAPTLDANFSPDGTRIVSTVKDGTLRVWDWASGAELAVLRHEGVTSAMFSLDGTRVLSVGRSGARVWKWASGDLLAVLEDGGIRSAAFSPDSAHVVTTDGSGRVKVWRLDSEAAPTELIGGRFDFDAAFSPDGTRVVIAKSDGVVRVWEWVSRAEPVVLRGVNGLRSVAFNADGTRVVSAANDGTMKVWDWPSGAELTVLRNVGAVSDATLSPNGALVAAVGQDQTARVWDWARGVEVAVLHHERAYSAGFSPDGRLVVTAGEDGTVRVWQWASRAEPIVLNHGGTVYSAGISSDGDMVVSAAQEGSVKVWDLATGAERIVLNQGVTANSAAFSPDGTRVVGAGYADGTVKVWDWKTGAELAVLRREGITSATFSPDGKRVLSVSEGGKSPVPRNADEEATAIVWDWAAGTELAVLRHERAWYLTSGEFSPDGTLVVTADNNGAVRIWDWASGASPTVLTHDHDVTSVAFSPDGTRVVTAQDDGTITVWQWARREAQSVLRPGGYLTSVAFDPDGTRVVSADNDGTVRVLELASRAEFAVLRHGHSVLSAVFSPDGTRVVTAAEDGTVRVWPCRACSSIKTVRAMARALLP